MRDEILHYLLVELCTGLLFIHFLFIVSSQKACPFRFSGLFAFPQYLNFSFLLLKRAHNLEVMLSIDPSVVGDL